MKKIIDLMLVLMLLAGCTKVPAPASSNIVSDDDAESILSTNVSKNSSVVEGSDALDSASEKTEPKPTTSKNTSKTTSTNTTTSTTAATNAATKPAVTEPAYAEAGGTIPTGATYTVKASGKVLKAGEKMPSKPADGDKFDYGDYIYTYFASLRCSIPDKEYFVYDGWSVHATDKEKTKYGAICEKINGYYIKHMNNTFSKCDNLVESPAIPDTVETMEAAYYNNKKLKKMPKLPKNLKFLEYSFMGCSALETITQIPDGVISLEYAFCNCTS